MKIPFVSFLPMEDEIRDELRQAFDELDVTNPYDNGLTYRKATDVYLEYSRNGSAILRTKSGTDFPAGHQQAVF